jgi:hypothetical protein
MNRYLIFPINDDIDQNMKPKDYKFIYTNPHATHIA